MRSQNKTQIKERKGDTGRTSSQGRKLASGGKITSDKRGDPEMDEDAKSVKTELKIRSQRARPRRS